MKLGIALCVYRDLTPETLASLWPLAQAGALLGVQKGADVAVARNRIVKSLLTTDVEVILFVDGDMFFTPEDVERTVKTLTTNPELGAVSALYIKWDGSQLPICNWRRNGSWLSDEDRRKRAAKHARHKETTYVDSFGGGLLAVSRGVFEKVEPPWFEGRYVDGLYEGNDTTFCRRLQEAGYKPAVNFGIPVGHVGPTLWDASGLKEMT